MKSEAETRQTIIDKKLKEAGWDVKNLSQVSPEFDIAVPYLKVSLKLKKLLKTLPSVANRPNNIVTTFKSNMAGSFHYFYRQVMKHNNGSTVGHVNVKDIKKILVIAPPIVLQNQFATIVEKIESVKLKFDQNLSDFEKLYGAISQKAFNGVTCEAGKL
jgi:hypothetical protein